MELHTDLNNTDLWVNQFRYLHNLNDYLWFILITLIGFYFINLIIKKLNINFFFGNLINTYHLSYNFFVVLYAEKFAHDSNSIFSFAKGGPGTSLELKFQIVKGSEFLGLLLAPFARHLDLSILNLSLIFTFISSTMLLYFYDLVMKINPNNKLNKLIAIIIIFLPSLNFFTSGITKECLTVSIFIYIFWNIVNGLFFKKQITIILLLIFLILLRPYMGSILFVFLSYSLFISKKSIFSKNNLLYFRYPFFILMLIFSTYFFSTSMDVKNLISLDKINQFILNRQQLTMIGYSYNIIDTNLIYRIFIYIFGSFFILSNSFFELFLIVENLIMFILFSLIVLSLLKNKIYLPKFNFEFYIFLLFSITMIILLSNITANFGIIARNKYNFILVLWIFLFNLNRGNKIFKK